ncbi:MAG: UDP-2,3-diacylglucosamine diphosphatase LpxI [Alphaproteobacteria bacterium]|nr:UDP-2,3-diacylglucosamine diphosphatase LpxI [Alphaproteobacteria bacterium]
METRPHQPNANGRLAIIAGRGRLPLHVAAAARAAGDDPFVIGLKGEACTISDDFDHEFVSLGDITGVHRIVKENGIDRVIMSGGVDRRPERGEVRAPLRMIPGILLMMRILTGGGDDKLLRAVISIIEAAGCRVVGAQEIVPDLVAKTGSITKRQPTSAEWQDIRTGYAGADMLGRLDVGQGAVAIGGRIVALEGPEGTDRMLDRVAELREAGRITRKHKGVLIKLCKPQQDQRADLPSMGPKTIENAERAGLTGIAIEAGRAFILDQAETIAKADARNMFVVGIDRDNLDAELKQRT